MRCLIFIGITFQEPCPLGFRVSTNKMRKQNSEPVPVIIDSSLTKCGLTFFHDLSVGRLVYVGALWQVGGLVWDLTQRFGLGRVVHTLLLALDLVREQGHRVRVHCIFDLKETGSKRVKMG